MVAFSQVKPNTIKLRVLPQFPSKLLEGPGIAIDTANGAKTISVDFSGLTRDDITDPTTLYVGAWDTTEDVFKLVLGSNLKGDKGDQGDAGPVSASDYATKATVQAATISVLLNYLRISGYTASGDGGAALYKRVGSQPTHNGKIQSADGAWWEIASPNINIHMFGGVGDGSTDDTTALNSAIGYIKYLGRGEINFLAKTYKLASAIALTCSDTTSSFVFKGAGPDVTTLYWPNGSGGITVNYAGPGNSTQFIGMSLTTGHTGGGGTAITLNQSASVITYPAYSATTTIEDVTIHGSDGYQTPNLYWDVGVQVNSVSNINFMRLIVEGVYPHGNGVVLAGTSSAYAVVYNFTSCSFNGLSIGINYGGATGYVQGVTVSQSNFTGVDYGVANGPGLVGNGQLSVTDSQFTTYGGAGIYEASAVDGTNLVGNLFLAGQSNSSLVVFLTAQNFTLVGNTFECGVLTGVTGVVVGTYGGGAGAILGNTFSHCNAGVNLASGSSNVQLGPNSYRDVGTAYTNASANTANIVFEPGVFHAWTPTFNFTGGSTVAASSVSGSWVQLGNKIELEVRGTITYSVIPTVITVTLPNSFVAEAAQVQIIPGWNPATGLILGNVTGGGTTMAVLSAAAAIPITASGQVLNVSGKIAVQ